MKLSVDETVFGSSRSFSSNLDESVPNQHHINLAFSETGSVVEASLKNIQIGLVDSATCGVFCSCSEGNAHFVVHFRKTSNVETQ